MTKNRKGLVRALNYEFARLELGAVAFLESGRKKVQLQAREGVVTLSNAYRAMMCVAGVKADDPYQEREDALTKVLALAE